MTSALLRNYSAILLKSMGMPNYWLGEQCELLLGKRTIIRQTVCYNENTIYSGTKCKCQDHLALVIEVCIVFKNALYHILTLKHVL